MIFGSPCVPKHISVPCVSPKSTYIPSPLISTTKPDAIQPSPHTHPNHKHNKMSGLIQPSPKPPIATPVPPLVSLRRLSCFSYLANIGCVFFCQVCRSGMEPSRPKPHQLRTTQNRLNEVVFSTIVLGTFVPYF